MYKRQVYAYDYDTEQAALLQSFRSNLLTISVMIALLVTGLSIMLSRMPVSYTHLDVYKRQPLRRHQRRR